MTFAFADPARIARIAEAYIVASGLWGVWDAQDGPTAARTRPPGAYGPGFYFATDEAARAAASHRARYPEKPLRLAAQEAAREVGDGRYQEDAAVIEAATNVARERWISADQARQNGDLAGLNRAFRAANERLKTKKRAPIAYPDALEWAICASFSRRVLDEKALLEIAEAKRAAWARSRL